MKKTILIAIALLFAISLNATNILLGTYTMTREFGVRYSTADNTYNIEIIGGKYSDSDLVLLSIKESDISQFRESLINVRSKYIEWTRVAKENNIVEISKEIPITFKDYSILWYTSEWQEDSSESPRFVFHVYENLYYVTVVGRAISDNNIEIEQSFCMLFHNPGEMQSLIDVLDPVNINRQIQKSNTQSSLFK